MSCGVCLTTSGGAAPRTSWPAQSAALRPGGCGAERSQITSVRPPATGTGLPTNASRPGASKGTGRTRDVTPALGADARAPVGGQPGLAGRDVDRVGQVDLRGGVDR